MKKVVVVFMAIIFIFAEYCLCFAVTWRYDLKDALKAAINNKKPLMVDFYTEWCGWCKKLDQDVYTDSKVNQLARQFICVKVDADKYREDVKKYSVSGYPTVLFLNSEGLLLSKIVGYQQAAPFANIMQGIVNKTRKQETVREKKSEDAKANKTSATNNKQNSGEFHLTGVISGGKEKMAFINGSIAKVGDTINGATVQKIEAKKVELTRNGDTIIIEME